jgi:type IV pilus assembly protein PilO
MDLKNIDLSNVNWNDAGSWPLPLKVVGVVLACAAILAGGYYFDTQNQAAELNKLELKEQGLKEDFTRKQNKAVNLPLYKQQMEEMEKSFGAMLRQLPSKTQVAELLADVSQTGLANGLEFQLFKPKDEVPAEFYAELPIQVRVRGSYHEFGDFVSDVAALPRIVTVQDISIRPRGDKADSTDLVMEAVAKTYRYLDEGEGKK